MGAELLGTVAMTFQNTRERQMLAYLEIRSFSGSVLACADGVISLDSDYDAHPTNTLNCSYLVELKMYRCGLHYCSPVRSPPGSMAISAVRTLLIATTLVAVVLGLVVFARC